MNKQRFKNYEKVKELARKMAELDKKPYFIYKNGDRIDFEPVYPVSNNLLEALEFVFPL